jgi:hypothetical protein
MARGVSNRNAAAAHGGLGIDGGVARLQRARLTVPVTVGAATAPIAPPATAPIGPATSAPTPAPPAAPAMRWSVVVQATDSAPMSAAKTSFFMDIPIRKMRPRPLESIARNGEAMVSRDLRRCVAWRGQRRKTHRHARACPKHQASRPKALAVHPPVSFPAGAKRRGRETMTMRGCWIPFPALRAAGDDTEGRRALSNDRTGLART